MLGCQHYAFGRYIAPIDTGSSGTSILTRFQYFDYFFILQYKRCGVPILPTPESDACFSNKLQWTRTDRRVYCGVFVGCVSVYFVIFIFHKLPLSPV
jgi:hypothetical protein